MQVVLMSFVLQQGGGMVAVQLCPGVMDVGCSHQATVAPCREEVVLIKGETF